MTAPAQIVAEHVSKIYRMGDVTVPALDDVSVQIAAGEIVCIMGKSGSGKSTLLRQLGLIDTPSTGRLRVDAQDVTGLSESKRAHMRLARLGYVFQEYALIPELTAEENVYLPAMMLGGRRREYRARAAELLTLVGLSARMRHRPRALSGGEQQRVAIARALVNSPLIVYADEPTANLDSAASATVMQTLVRLNRELGVTVVIVSHDPEDSAYARRVIRLHDGRIVEDGPIPDRRADLKGAR